MANRIFSPRLSLGELGLGLQLARCRQLKPKARVFSPLLARPPQPQLLSSYFSTTMSNNSDVTKGPQSAHFAAKTKTMLPPNSFKDKVVFVTGGGTGLGKGMSMKFSELGAKVAIVARRLPVLETAAQEISASTGNVVLPLQCDIRDPAAIQQAVDLCVEKTIVDIVLNGTAYLTLDVGKRMIAAGRGGAFLAITTHYTNEGSGYVVPSACAKSGVETMMKSLGVEWGRKGIRMNCIAPGPIETEGAFSRLGRRFCDFRFPDMCKNDPTGQMMQHAVDINPTGRMGEVEEIANLATYLCSDYASWINAETVTLDGGEFRSLAGEFNGLRQIPEEMWDMMEKMIRDSNKKQKSKI